MAIDYTRRDRNPAPPEPQPPASVPPAAPPSSVPPVSPPAGGGINYTRPGRSTPPPPATPVAAPPSPAAAPPPPAPASPAAQAPPISLSKVTLTKNAPSVSLTKGGQRQGVMRVNLNWTAKSPSKGFLAKIAGTDSIDLDLGCLYELSDGTKGGIQALGNSFGNLQRPPYILLDGDDRSGASVGGENLLINLEEPGRFRRILIFAMIYQGATRWTEANGVVTLFPTAGPQIEVKLDGESTNAPVCSIALLENHGGDLVVQREVKYISGSQKKLDEAYNWGLRWAPGSK
jgi:tellurite resistance protein TerA